MTTIKKIKIIALLFLLPLFGLAQNTPILYNNYVDGYQPYDRFGVNDFSEDGSIMTGSLVYYSGNNTFGTFKAYQYDGNGNWNQLGGTITETSTTNMWLYPSADLNAAGNTMAISTDKTYTSNTIWPVKVLRYNGSDWEQLGQTIIENGYVLLQAKLNADGTKIAVGMVKRTNPSTSYDYVRIYEFNGTEWVKSGEDIPLQNAGDRVGHLNFSLDGNMVTFSGTGSAQSYVISYQYNGTAWAQKGQILYRDEMESDPYKTFYSIRMSGDASTIAVETSIPNYYEQGAIYMYGWDASSNSWIQKSNPIIVLGQSEVSISTNGKRIMTGNRMSTDVDYDNGGANGEARVFDYDPTLSSWKQVFFIQPWLKWSYVGASIGISGNGKRFAYGQTPEGSPGGISLYNFVEPTEVSLSIAAGADQYIHTGETVQLEAAVLPEDFENQQVQWSVASGEDFVSVNDNGLVTGIANGTATLKAVSAANPDIYGSIQITVLDGTPPENHNCSQEFAADGAIANGAAIFVPNGYWAANDFNVEEGSTFTLKNITVPVISLGGVPMTYNVKVYKDDNNMPGEEIASFSNLTGATQSIIQDVSYTYLVYSSTLDLGEGTALPGGNKYWIALAASPTTADKPLYWAGTNTSETEPTYQSTDNGSTWAIVEGAFDGVFTISGECKENLAVSESGASQFTYYPNPVKDILNIRTDKAIKNISVYNPAGQKVKDGLKAANGQLNLSSLAEGNYILYATMETGEVKTFKIIKK